MMEIYLHKDVTQQDSSGGVRLKENNIPIEVNNYGDAALKVVNYVNNHLDEFSNNNAFTISTINSITWTDGEGNQHTTVVNKTIS